MSKTILLQSKQELFFVWTVVKTNRRSNKCLNWYRQIVDVDTILAERTRVQSLPVRAAAILGPK